MRIFAIDSLLRSQGSKTAGIDNVILTKDNAQEFLDLLVYKKLKVYKSSPVRISSISNVGIHTVYDRLVQKLFLLVLDPVIDVHSDRSSYGFRKGRNAHQAIGLVSSILSKQTTKKYLVQDKYIIKINIKNFLEAYHAID
jgi:retron-type reverse transcriptase